MPPRKKQNPTDAVAPAASGRKKKTTAAAEAAAPRGRAKKKAETAATPAAAPAVDPRKQTLVIVESPAKAKTIAKYLGSGFKVLASYGHVRDLPRTGKVKGEEEVGVNIANGWVPRYQVIEREGEGGRGRRSAKDILNDLKREADRSNLVYLATDPDREGESIAWHIEQALGLDDARTFRITFNEITRSAVQQAIQHPDKINMDRVSAQEARRVLDRVVGYPLSNLLGRKVTRGLSAGRVQSVAVRLIVDREREIEAFKTEEYWKVTALLAPQGTVAYTPDPARAKVFAKKKGAAAEQPAKKEKEEAPEAEGAEQQEGPALPKVPAGAFLAELARWQGKEFRARTEAETDAVVAALQNVPYVVTKVDQKDRNEHAPPPFTTSTLQQQANIRLRMSAKHTMTTAQRLYEGVDLGSEGSVALITYMRTDSTRVSNDALNSVRQHISASYGAPYLPAKPNSYASGKSAQEAHEAIRPTDLSYTPQRVQPHLKDDEYRLYTLIYNRFVASQMTPAVFAVTNVEVEAGQGLFKAQGKIEKFDGYRRVLPPAGKSEDVMLPALTEKQLLDRLDLIASQHFTQPPPRYNEASLVKALEKEGIGRPSTYASIISTIVKRGYVKLEHRRFYATDIGKVVTDLLVKHFPKVMDMKFTSLMEDHLDQIETRQTQYEQVLNEFWTPFSEALQAARDQMPAQKGVEIGEACPKCGRPLVEQYSKKTGGKFIGCSGWRDKENPCRYKRTLEGKEITGPVETEHKCPACGSIMVQNEGRFGIYLTCSKEGCPTTMNIGPDGKPVISALPTEHKCDKCGSSMVLREWKGKRFMGCSNYPKCRFSLDVDAQGNPIRPADTGVVCDKCGEPMRIKTSFRGPFLSCSGYPKCRNAKPLTAELKEKLKDQLPAAAAKKEAPAVEVTETCPDCGGPMKVRNSARGPFLGCAKYPKCKGTRQASPELLEKLQEAGAR